MPKLRTQSTHIHTDQANATVEIVVPFTSPPVTRAALQHAGRMASALNLRITLLWVHEVPFPLPVGRPAVSISFLRQAAQDLASQVGAQAEVHLTRDPDTIWKSRIHSETCVVLATRKRWWRTPEEKLARLLTRFGHNVLCFPASAA